MSQENYTTKQRKFKHLNAEKRAQIEILLKIGMSKSQIAREVGISRSTLYNELSRGTVTQLDSELRTYKRYFSDAGQRVYEEHRRNSRNPLKIAKAAAFIDHAEEQILNRKLSPDAICGREAVDQVFAVRVCTRTLYNYISHGLLRVKNIDLLLKVKRKTKKDVDRANKRQYGRSIEERPDAVNDRSEPGHWELDTIVGCTGSSSVLLSCDERCSRKRILIKIPAKTADAVGEGIRQIKLRFGEKFGEIFKSVTSDNGSEFAHLSEQLPEVDVYYAHPYSAYERGTNEKQNSLVRRFLPKGSDFDTVSDSTIARIEHWCNSLPRKIFNYRTPDALFLSIWNCLI